MVNKSAGQDSKNTNNIDNNKKNTVFKDHV